MARHFHRRHRFVRRYTPADIGLLAGVDEVHETLSGPATQKILYREFHDYGDQRYSSCAPFLPESAEQFLFGVLHPAGSFRVALRARLSFQLGPRHVWP